MMVWPKHETMETIEGFDQEFTRIHGALIDPRDSDVNDAWITEFRKTTLLKTHWENFEAFEQTHPNKNWQWLRQRLRDYIQRNRAFDNAEQLIADTVKRQQNNAEGSKNTTTQESANNTNNSSKSLCRFHIQGHCKFGDKCTESHQGDMKNLIKRAAKAYGIPVTPAFQNGEEDKGDKAGKKGKTKGKGAGKSKKKGDNGDGSSDASSSESDGEGGRRRILPFAERPCLNTAHFGKCDNHEKKLCPYAHDQKTQADYKAGKIEGYEVEKGKKIAETIKAKGQTQFSLPLALHLKQ
jgi:hypothetical protein